MSAIPARMKPQLLTGPQKCVVLGPTGLFKNALSAVGMADDLAPSTAACLPSAGAGGVDGQRLRNGLPSLWGVGGGNEIRR